MKKAFLKLHLAVFLAGLTGILGKVISLNAEMLVWYRMLIALGACFILLWFTKKNVIVPLKEVVKLASIGVLLALHWVFFYASVKFSNVSVAVVCFSLGGFFTALLEPLLCKTKFSFQAVAISMLSLLGIMLIFHFDTHYRVGILFGIACALFVAFFAIANSRAVSHHSPEIVLFYDMAGGTLFLSLILPIYYYFQPPVTFLPTDTDLLCLLFLSLVCTVGMLLLENQAMQYISAFTVNLSFNLESVYSIAIALVFFGEAKELSWSFYLGLLFIIMSVAFQTILALRKKPHINHTMSAGI